MTKSLFIARQNWRVSCHVPGREKSKWRQRPPTDSKWLGQDAETQDNRQSVFSRCCSPCRQESFSLFCFYTHSLYRISLYTRVTDPPADAFTCVTASTARVPGKTESRVRASEHRRTPCCGDAMLAYIVDLWGDCLVLHLCSCACWVSVRGENKPMVTLCLQWTVYLPESRAAFHYSPKIRQFSADA